jgi:hypothetical protein
MPAGTYQNLKMKGGNDEIIFFGKNAQVCIHACVKRGEELEKFGFF